MIDDLARAENVLGLERGSRIWDIDLIVDPEPVACAGLRAGNVGGEPAVLAALERIWLVDQEIDALGRRGPQTKRRATRDQSCAEMPSIHAEPEKASTERGGAVASLPDAKPATACLTSAVFNSCCQLLYSAITGSLNAIASGAALSTMKIGA